MKIDHMTFNYRVDINSDIYLEYKLGANEKNVAAALEGETIKSELWCINRVTDDRWRSFEEFSFNVSDKKESVFDMNFYQALRKLRGQDILLGVGGEDYSVDCHWLSYEREFYTVLPILLCWGHALLRINIDGKGTNGHDFAYEYETGRLQYLYVDGHGGWKMEIPQPGETIRDWFGKIDDFITDRVNLWH